MTEEFHVIVGSEDTAALVLHTDSDCTYIQHTETRTVTREQMPGREVCSRCRGDDSRSGGDWSHQRALREAAKA